MNDSEWECDECAGPSSATSMSGCQFCGGQGDIVPRGTARIRTTCACGLPLHYNSPVAERIGRTQTELYGVMIPITTPAGTWLVQRHYVLLHGLRAMDLPSLPFARIA